MCLFDIFRFVFYALLEFLMINPWLIAENIKLKNVKDDSAIKPLFLTIDLMYIFVFICIINLWYEKMWRSSGKNIYLRTFYKSCDAEIVEFETKIWKYNWKNIIFENI